ncbi:YncE family protein [Actinoplanes utahensis]|uniref:Ig-like domain repeat protein n=1 Tax=Actinoplanes utahensis TaxID=1869 RepID=A0A0A6UEG5_ACTUT|nr:hypothetical protein [Actinoplanes utahensis]KHD73861.1 hypothetical protein MB27_33095 [Actinoplanes utahensis]GIF27742.1 hypothetical protein Aut01nite_07280 [Actinoplanes utahensis]
MRTKIAAATAAAMMASSVVLAGASPARADQGITIAAQSASDLIADGVNKRLFFYDKTSGQIVAIGYNGAPLGKYALSAVHDLALAPDSSALYASLPDAHKIVALNPATLALIAEYDLGAEVTPYYLAVAGGKVWIGHAESTSGGKLASLDVSGDAPVVTPAVGAGDWLFRAPQLETSASGRLLAIGRGDHVVFDVSDGTAKPVSRRASDESQLTDLALSSDGQQYVTLNGSILTAYRVSDQAQLGQTWAHSGVGIDLSADGVIAAAADQWYGPDLSTFTPGAGALIRQYDLPNTGDTSASDGFTAQAVAWEPGGSRVFGISVNSHDQHTLRVYTEPRLNLPTLTLAGPATAARAKSLLITGSLKSTVALPAGTPVTVSRVDVESPKGKVIATRTTNADGVLWFNDVPPAGGRVYYKVGYAGDAKHAPVVAWKTVDVSRATPGLTINNNGKVYGYGSTATFTAKLTTAYKNRVVEFWADPYGTDQGRRLLKRVTVTNAGLATVSLKVARNTAVQVVFAGDARFAGRAATSVVYTRVPVTTTLTKHYKTANIGGVSYKHYKKNVQPLVTAAMPWYPNRAAYLRADFWYQGRWEAWGDIMVNLNSAGKAQVNMETMDWAGYKFRVRAAYRTNESGDNINYTSYSPYQYFYISK